MASPSRVGSRSVWTIAAPHRFLLALLATVSLAGALLEAGFLVLLTGAALGLASGRPDLGGPTASLSLPTVLALAAVAIAVRLALGLAGVRISASLTARVTAEHRRQLADAFLGAAWEVQSSEPAGRLQELLTSFVYRATSAMQLISQGLTAVLSLIAFLATGIFVDALSTTAVLGALALLALVLAPLRRFIRARSGRSAQANLRFANAVAELGTLGQEMQVYGARDQFKERISILTAAATEETRRVQVLSGALTPVYTFLAYSAVVAALGILSSLNVANLAAVGAVLLLMLRSLSYGQQLLSVIGSLAAVEPFLERLDTALTGYLTQPAPSGELTPISVAPLTLEDVGFTYPNGRVALQDVNLVLEPGEMLGIIGPSGAGKSTLAHLLLGLQLPSSGAVHVQGIPLSDISRDWWTQRVTFVPQEALLFTGSVADNLRFFRPSLSDDDLRSASAQANVLEDILALPLGFATHLGERGRQLSGGQRQRMSLARALAGAPDLLILDEPTSALDGHSEQLIKRTLSHLRGRVTTVIIAHRMSTLESCDRVMVIEGGRVTALGTAAEVRRNSAFYRRSLEIAGLHVEDPTTSPPATSDAIDIGWTEPSNAREE